MRRLAILAFILASAWTLAPAQRTRVLFFDPACNGKACATEGHVCVTGTTIYCCDTGTFTFASCDQGAGGGGDVTGPGSSVDNEIARFNSTTGKVIQAYTSGGPTVSDTGDVSVLTLNNILYADRFAGADAGAKIAACVAALPAGGGTCDARAFEGAQAIASTVTVGESAVILLGYANYICAASPCFDFVTAGKSSSLIGVGRGSTTIEGSRITATDGTITPLIRIEGTSTGTRITQIRLENFTLEGVFNAAQVGLDINFATGVSLDKIQFTELGQAEDIDDAFRIFHDNCNYFHCGTGDTAATSTVRVENRTTPGTPTEQIYFNNSLWEGDATAGNNKQGIAIYVGPAVTQTWIQGNKFDYGAMNPDFRIIVIEEADQIFFSHNILGSSTITSAAAIIDITGQASNRAKQVILSGNRVFFRDAVPAIRFDWAQGSTIANDIYQGEGGGGTAVEITSNALAITAGPFKLFSAGDTAASNSSSSSVVAYHLAGSITIDDLVVTDSLGIPESDTALANRGQVRVPTATDGLFWYDSAERQAPALGVANVFTLLNIFDGGVESESFTATGTAAGQIVLTEADPGSNTVTLQPAARTLDLTLDFPDESGTQVAVTETATQTLTAKTLTSAILNGSVTVPTVNGVDYTPGSDTDADLITVNVTGTPKMWWDEATDAFEMNKTLSVLGIGDGALGSYDLNVGDTTTPDYGIIRFGDGLIGRTSHNVASLDLDGSVIFRNMGTPATSNIEFVWTESGGGAIRFALAKSGAGNAAYNPRSMIIAGPAVNDDEVVTVGYWQTNNSIFHNLAMDTGTDGADLGVQNDLEVEGDIFTDSIKESTSGAGITLADNLITSAGRVLNTTRITGNTTLDATHHNVFTDTDGGAVTVTLPAGVDGTYYRIINSGGSGNNVTIPPDGAELLLGVNSSVTLLDGQVLIIVFETTEGWW